MSQCKEPIVKPRHTFRRFGSVCPLSWLNLLAVAGSLVLLASCSSAHSPTSETDNTGEPTELDESSDEVAPLEGISSEAEAIARNDNEGEDASTSDGPTVDDNDDVVRMPIAVFLHGGRSASEQAELVQEELRQQSDFVQDCMAQAGFDRVPLLDPAAFGAEMFDQSPVPEITAEGTYGIVPTDITLDWIIDRQFAPLIEAARIRIANPEPLRSEAEQAMYDSRRASCFALARTEVRLTPSISAELARQLDELDERINSDAAVIAGWDAWTSCVSAEGLNAERPSDLFAKLAQEWQFVSVQILSFSEPYSLDDVFVALETDPDAAIRMIRASGIVDVERVDALRAEEHRVAAADEACRGDLAQLLADTRALYEQQFISENRPLLEEAVENQ